MQFQKADAVRLVTGAVLAGGRSLRMGRDKRLVRLPNGLTMASNAERVLSVSPGGVILLSGPGGIPDLRAGKGPLGGIEAVLYRADSAGVLFLPCDMPFITNDVINRMIEVFARSRGLPAVVMAPFMEPLLAVVPLGWRERITNTIDCGHLKVGRLWADCGFNPVFVGKSRTLADVDHPWEVPA